MQQPLIILFAKAPVPGHVKTRLAATIGKEGAAALHVAFVQDTIDLLRELKGVALELHTDERTGAWSAAGLPSARQVAGGLGERMLAALADGLQRGYLPVMIVGSDAPTIPPGHLQELIEARADVALGPAEDGGFYAISCRRIEQRMFEGVAWSSEQTLMQTVQSLNAAGLQVSVGRPWFDVDEPRDLERLLTAGEVPRHTAEWHTFWRAAASNAMTGHP